jgi:hypothetical protein
MQWELLSPHHPLTPTTDVEATVLRWTSHHHCRTLDSGDRLLLTIQLRMSARHSFHMMRGLIAGYHTLCAPNIWQQ